MRIDQTLYRIINAFFLDYSSWNKTPHASDINGGDCAIFAAVAHHFIKDIKLIYTNFYGGHAFFELNGLYYDAENVEGVEKWQHLDRSFSRGHDVVLRYVTYDELIKEWNLSRRYINRILNHLR